jgi:hypothetical protein
LWAAVQEVHGLEQTDEGTLAAHQLASQYVAHTEDDQIQVMGPVIISLNPMACFEEMVNEDIGVAEGAGGQHSIDL